MNRYTKIKIAAIIFLILLTAVCIVFACFYTREKPHDMYETYTAVYTADKNGSISGETKQKVKQYKNANEVVAVPNEGYIFAGWSDGKYLPSRQDEYFTGDIEVCATFISKTKTLKYDYNGATSNNGITTVTLNYDNLADTSFVIPTKANCEFQGWYLDKEFTRKVADKDGVYYLGKSIFYSDADTIYARWEKREGLVYPILMLYIGNMNAQFKNLSDGEIYSINHEMTIPEIKTCEQITSILSDTLNEWFDGKVYFELHSFFTASEIDARIFMDFYPMSQPIIANAHNPTLSPPLIPEAAPILKSYRSVLTTFYSEAASVNVENNNTIDIYNGYTSQKYSILSINSIFYGKDPSKPIPIENFMRDDITAGYIHEFIHTVEFAIEIFDYHDYSAYYSWEHHNEGDLLKADKLYLLNQADWDGYITGIPFTYWEGNIAVGYNYLAQNYIHVGEIKLIGDYKNVQALNLSGEVQYGSSITVEAIPYDEYRFVAWSDGVTTAIRTDENITSYLCVYAIFEKI